MSPSVALCDCNNPLQDKTITNARDSVMNIRTYKQDAPSIIRRLYKAEGVNDPKQLEVVLINKGYGGRNLVTQWISRNKISQGFLEAYSSAEGVNLDWLVHGRGDQFASK